MSTSLDIFNDYAGLVSYLNQDPKHYEEFFREIKPQQERIKITLDKLESLTIDDYIKSSYNQRLAFWINTYNIYVLKILLDHYTDLKSKKIMKTYFMKNLFDILCVKIFNKIRTLNQIKKEIFEEEFDDPRVIFALYMGAKDGPNLNYYPLHSTINIELDQATRRYLEAHLSINTIHHFIALSSYMEWWAEEWKEKMISYKYIQDLQFSERPIKEKLILILLKNHCLEPDAIHSALLDPKLKIRFTRFDWVLKY